MKKTKWILVAEDDEPLAELTMMALQPEKLACQVIVTHDGLATMDCLSHHGEFQTRDGGNPVFVLLDLKMPKVNGLEVLRRIRSDARLKNIPVVIFTSSREITDVDHSYELGANAYVVKPTGFQEFNYTLQHVGRFWAELNELPPDNSHLEAAACAPGDIVEHRAASRGQ